MNIYKSYIKAYHLISIRWMAAYSCTRTHSPPLPFSPYSATPRHVQGGQLFGVLELPGVQSFLGGTHDVGLGHGQIHWVNFYILGVQWCPDGIAEN